MRMGSIARDKTSVSWMVASRKGGKRGTGIDKAEITR